MLMYIIADSYKKLNTPHWTHSRTLHKGYLLTTSPEAETSRPLPSCLKMAPRHSTSLPWTCTYIAHNMLDLSWRCRWQAALFVSQPPRGEPGNDGDGYLDSACLVVGWCLGEPILTRSATTMTERDSLIHSCRTLARAYIHTYDFHPQLLFLCLHGIGIVLGTQYAPYLAHCPRYRIVNPIGNRTIVRKRGKPPFAAQLDSVRFSPVQSRLRPLGISRGADASRRMMLGIGFSQAICARRTRRTRRPGDKEA
ncbi:hypothetical protein F4808DRAFT_414859 [Astrocystis sublimbata]|nr:hypothetical protein F4808DRAFT_414859 [Astrocystis sublimbata]